MRRLMVAIAVLAVTGVGCNNKESDSKVTLEVRTDDFVVLAQTIRDLKELQVEVSYLKRRLNQLQMENELLKTTLASALNFNLPYTIRNVKITFYSNDRYSINVPRYRDGLTATHIPVGEGVIAVDPNLIPYGSVVYIPRLRRFFVACDTGSAIKGKHIDVYVDSRKEAIRNGVMYSDVIVVGKVDLNELRSKLTNVAYQ
jgi:3D (Asp-Asp-Asp) domain-containing protein